MKLSKVVAVVSVALLVSVLSGCVVAPAPGYYGGGGVWVPGHYGPYGGWHPGHYAY